MSQPRTVRTLLAKGDHPPTETAEQHRLREDLADLRARRADAAKEYCFAAQDAITAFQTVIALDALIQSKLPASLRDPIPPASFHARLCLPAPPPTVRPEGFVPQVAHFQEFIPGGVPDAASQSEAARRRSYEIEAELARR